MIFADIFYVRKIIEPRVAELAAENATPEEIREMERILKYHEESIGNREKIIETDSAFHKLMAKATTNHVMERLIVVLIDLLKQSHDKYLIADGNDERAKKSLKGHHRVLSAVEKGDGEAARKAMLQHLEDIEIIVYKR